jgi:hypothetical protein
MRSWSKRGWMLVCCLGVAVLCASTALAATLRWSIQSGTGKGLHNAVLVGVSCGSPHSCSAVGESVAKAGAATPVAEQWSGKAWKVQRAAVPSGSQSTELFDVSCFLPARCTATGRYLNKSRVTVSLAERWNGKKWAIQRTANVAGAGRNTLRGVSCPSNNWCMAVGAYKFPKSGFRILAERWNGHSWSVQKPPNPSAGPFGSELITVSCTSSRACFGVGDAVDNTGHVRGLVEHWNGKKWTIQSVPLPAGAFRSQLVGVDCAATSTCEAVGYYAQTATTGQVGFSETWDGHHWTMQTMPKPAGAQQALPLDVACASATACTAVGEVLNAHSTELTLAENYDGTKWQTQSTPNPRGAKLSLFNAASCLSATNCEAVGGFTSATGSLPLAERYS